jgi:hypothetical protein
LNSLNLIFYLWTEKSWEKVRCKQVRLDKNLLWRKESVRYRQFPLCTGSIPYKNHEKTSFLHKMSVDDRFPLWKESVVDRFYCIYKFGMVSLIVWNMRKEITHPTIQLDFSYDCIQLSLPLTKSILSLWKWPIILTWVKQLKSSWLTLPTLLLKISNLIKMPSILNHTIFHPSPFAQTIRKNLMR